MTATAYGSPWATFMRKVPHPRDPAECWPWGGTIDTYGYGSFWSAKRNLKAHRVMFEATVEDLLPGLVLDHTCRVRDCVNPAHLRQVTQRENLLAPGSEAIAARHAAKTHCPNGHPYDGETLLQTGPQAGHRQRFCRTCKRENQRERE